MNVGRSGHQSLTGRREGAFANLQNKNCGSWAQEWIKKSLPGLKVQEGQSYAEIIEVTSATGDCDLGQRKGK